MRYLASRLPEGGVMALIATICQRGQTGTLELDTDRGVRRLYFVGGQICFSRSEVPLAEQIAACQEAEPGAPGQATLRELLRLTSDYVKSWRVKTYKFFEGFRVDAEDLVGPLPTEFLLGETARLEEIERVDRLQMLGGIDAILEASVPPGSDLSDSLDPSELALLNHLLTPTRLRDLLGGSVTRSHHTLSVLSGLWVRGLISATARSASPPKVEVQESEVSPAGEVGQTATETDSPAKPRPRYGQKEDETEPPGSELRQSGRADFEPAVSGESGDFDSGTVSPAREERIWQYFGLRTAPFSLTPDPAFLYLSESHAEALAGLKLGLLERRGLCSMTGEVGTGKTTLLYTLLSSVGERFETAYVHNPALPFDELFEFILKDFGLQTPARARRIELLECLNEFLVDQARKGRIVALIIDEAQNLSSTTFESLRLLLNFETFDAKLLQIVLVGQPELAKRLQSESLRQIADRIAIRCQLKALSASETASYIDSRLQTAGADAGLFTRRALSLIARRTRGIPRRVNVLCHNAMMYAFAEAKSQVTRAQVAEAARDLKR